MTLTPECVRLMHPGPITPSVSLESASGSALESHVIGNFNLPANDVFIVVNNVVC